jgi:NAD(P)-dependent dehydrogenase (short-subunit alcohol dehydrogenase family)
MDDDITTVYGSNTERFEPHLTPTPDRLKGKVALVTGSGRGIGKAVALRFAQEGATLIVTDKDGEAARQAAGEIQKTGQRALAFEIDITNRPAIEQTLEAVLKEAGTVDILVNNAGIIIFGSLMECRPQDWDRLLAVDLTGAFNCTQIVGRQMVLEGRGGRMIHIGSTASLLPTAQQGAYCVAKAGLRMLSRMAAMELVQHGITSNLVCPQGAVTNLNRELLRDPALMAKIEAMIPAGRMARTEEIAAVAAFLASDEAAYITGAELVHDGGATIGALWWR